MHFLDAVYVQKGWLKVLRAHEGIYNVYLNLNLTTYDCSIRELEMYEQYSHQTEY